MNKISLLFVTFVTLVFSLNAMSIIHQEEVVIADTVPPIYPMDYQYVKEIAEYLSEIINTSYDENELAKGRYFGSAGEHDAADKIATEMANLGLFDPTLNSGKPYQEQIKSVKYTIFKKIPFRLCKLVQNIIPEKGKLPNLLNITKIDLMVNKSVNDTCKKFPVECYISPRWDLLKEDEWRPRFYLNKKLNFTDLKVIKTDNYTCKDSFLSLTAIKIPGINGTYNITEENISMFNKYQYLIILYNLIFPKKIEYDIGRSMRKAFQTYYGFNFSNMTHEDSSTWPTFLSPIEDDFVFIEEMVSFHPNNTHINLTKSNDWDPILAWSRIVTSTYTNLRREAWYLAYTENNTIKSLPVMKCKGIIKYDFLKDAYDTGIYGWKIPTIFINGKIGGDIYNDTENYTIDFKLNQKWEKKVESYNVIGQINGTNPNKTVIIGCLYDSMWCQGTVDSAIGVGVMLAIAKYFVQNEITPKYNLKFIAYGGEEVDLRGAIHYELNHSKENITAVIDLNQFGYEQQNVSSKFNIITNRGDFVKKLQYISDSITDYFGRTQDNVSELRTFWQPFGSGLSDDTIFATSRFYRRPKWRGNLKTVGFMKDFGWYRHHRDGMNHTEGDAIQYYSSHETNLTAEMIWNITKFFTTDPNCWFDGNPTIELWDSPDDNNKAPDHLNISYTIKTCMPDDRVTVKAVLFNNLRRKTKWEDYTITSNSDVNHYINFSLGKYAPFGYYRLNVYLFNSTGEVNNRVWCLDEDIRHPIRDEKYANDTYYKWGVYMGGLNDPSNTASQPSSSTQNMRAGTSYQFTTSATDPNSEQVYYQFDWGSNTREHEYSSWYGPYNSGANCEIPHTWTTTGDKQVRVRSRDKWFGPNSWSNWSDPLNITVKPGCAIFVERDTVLVDQQIDFVGVNYDFGSTASPANWNWSYGNGNTSTDEENTFQVYDTPNSYTVNLTLDNATSNVSYEIVVNVVNVSAGFYPDKYSAQLNETISFTDLSEGLNPITNWTWDFGDGNISYDQNPNHTYAVDGLYNVTLNVTDGSNISSFYQIVCIDSVRSTPVTAFYTTEIEPEWSTSSSYYLERVGYGSNITVIADFFDNLSGVNTAKFNVTYPDGNGENFTMIHNSSNPHDYEYIFDDTWQIGDHIYITWAVDKANNSNHSSNYLFIVEHLFGYTHQGSLNQSVEDRITGSVFKVHANGTADTITAYIQTNLSIPPKTKCMIHRKNDSVLIGTTEELTPTTGENASWMVFNFTGTKPSLVKDTEYVLTCWSNDTCYLYYDNTSVAKGRYQNISYNGSSPNPANWTANESRIYSIYCSYTATPEILDVSHTPDATLGLGSYVNISTVLNGFGCSFDNVTVNVSYPGNLSWNFTMDDIGNDTFEHLFYNENWLVGQYNYTIWAYDEFGSCCTSSGYSFNVSADATISICTVKDEYGNNETVNLTDPPEDPSSIGYELLDDGGVLHIWNKYDSYYFNTSSGIQLTNHYDEYWSHNVLMLGYYNNDEWNLIYRTDELSGFNKDIDTDNKTYVNATLWKDLTYKEYDFRFAIRYHLGVDDNVLTIIPYIKNLGQTIPYILGFAWEINDIQIDMTPEYDYIEINGTSFYLNQSLNVTYTDMENPFFYIMEDKPENLSESLYLKWNESLDYLVRIKSRSGEYNAPVTLAIKIGTLNVNQENFTELLWHDVSEKLYYFDSYDNMIDWATNPTNMVDGIISNYASTPSSGDIELCNGNTCSGSHLGTISKVEIRCYGKYSGSGGGGTPDIILQPAWPGGPHIFSPSTTGAWSSWFDITNDPNAPDPWTWNDIDGLDVQVEAAIPPGLFTLYCSRVEVRVTYTPNNPPGISNPQPGDSSKGVSLTPTLNITVSDADGDNMNITWFSDSSGSWQAFGMNNSVGNGTYRQTFSNATVNGQWWYWMVNVTDGTNYTVSSVYKFFTGYQSKIVNTGSTNISGYLCMQLHYYNETSQNWTIIDEPVNETIPRTINPEKQFGLDTVFNGKINTSYLSEVGNGTYRVYAAFRDLVGTPLVMDDETELMATYEFTITFA